MDEEGLLRTSEHAFCSASFRRSVITGEDANDNAKNVGHRPCSAPSENGSTSGTSGGSLRQTRINRNESPSMGHISTSNLLISHSSKSLSSSESFETPFGVIRKSSSSGIEPVRMHSGSSQESFRREMSVYKMNALPVLSEDADTSDDEYNCDAKADTLSKHTCKESKGKGKGKHPCNKYKVETLMNDNTERRVGKSPQGGNCLQRLLECVCKCSKTGDESMYTDKFLDLEQSEDNG